MTNNVYAVFNRIVLISSIASSEGSCALLSPDAYTKTENLLSGSRNRFDIKA